MPFRDVQTFLEDILESTDAITEFTAGFDYAAYSSDRKTRSAVERQLQILTEAAYRPGEDAERLCPTIDWRGVRGLGKVLRHEHQAVDDERIWQTLKERLPELHGSVAAALENFQTLEPRNPA